MRTEKAWVLWIAATFTSDFFEGERAEDGKIFNTLASPICRWAGENGIGLWGLEWSGAGERGMLRLLSDSGFFFQWLHSYLYYIVNFVCRSLDNNAVVWTRVGQSDGPGGGGIGAQGGRDGYAAQGEAHVVQVVKECTPEPKEIVGGPHGKERERRHSRWSGSGTRKREQAPDRRAQTRSRSPEPRGAGLERSSRRCLFDGSPRSRYQCKSKWTRFLGWDDHCSIQQKSLLVKCIRLSKQFHYYYYISG